jgi:hypothetical protein
MNEKSFQKFAGVGAFVVGLLAYGFVFLLLVPAAQKPLVLRYEGSNPEVRRA